MRTPRSRASSPSKTAAIAATDENTERHRPPKPRSPAVRDPQIPIVALAKRPYLPAVSSLGGCRAPAPASRPTVAKGPAPETLHQRGPSKLPVRPARQEKLNTYPHSHNCAASRRAPIEEIGEPPMSRTAGAVVSEFFASDHIRSPHRCGVSAFGVKFKAVRGA